MVDYIIYIYIYMEVRKLLLLYRGNGERDDVKVKYLVFFFGWFFFEVV